MVQPQSHSLPHSISGKSALTQHEPNSWQTPVQMVQTVMVRLVFNQLKWTHLPGAQAAPPPIPFKEQGMGGQQPWFSSYPCSPPLSSPTLQLCTGRCTCTREFRTLRTCFIGGAIVSLAAVCFGQKRLLNVSNENASEICNHNKVSRHLEHAAF